MSVDPDLTPRPERRPSTGRALAWARVFAVLLVVGLARENGPVVVVAGLVCLWWTLEALRLWRDRTDAVRP